MGRSAARDGVSELVRINRLTVSCSVVSHDIELSYEMDSEIEGTIRITFPFNVEVYADRAVPLFGMWGAAFLAQLCLAREVHLLSAFDHEAWQGIEPILQGLFDIRAYRDSLPLMAAPTAMGVPSRLAPLGPRRKYGRRRSCLLWSGGVDSTLAVNLLKTNNYDLVATHVVMNQGATDGEVAAVNRLAPLFDVEVVTVEYDFPNYLEVANKFSRVLDHFPLDNAIPHGRELLLVPIGYIVATALDCDSITLGHEHNAWTRRLEYLGRVMYKCDTQSEPANVAMQAYLTSYLNPDLRLFSPISPLSDYLKFRMLAQRDQAALSRTSACFWGRNCGVCSKCSLHFVLESAMNADWIHFERDPLSESTIIRDAVERWWDEGQTNWAEYQVSLAAMVGLARGTTDDLLLRYAEEVLPRISGRLPEIQSRLSTIYPVRLLPQEFRFD